VFGFPPKITTRFVPKYLIKEYNGNPVKCQSKSNLKEKVGNKNTENNKRSLKLFLKKNTKMKKNKTTKEGEYIASESPPAKAELIR